MRSNPLLVAAVALMLAGCTASKKTDNREPVIATLGSQPIYTSEFRYVYEKNNKGSEDAYTRQSVSEYLNLYTDYKLKVMEAESLGLDTTYAFKREWEGYKEEAQKAYLTDRSVTDNLVREAYERMKQDINASHILIRVPADADPQDTLSAYNRIVGLRNRAVGGEDFGKLAREFSQDPSAAENNGNIGYFTALQMVYPFEDAAYKTPVGEISMPVRTMFGYHLVKVHNARPARGEVKVAHIMIQANEGMPKADSLAAKQRIDAIYKRATRNENWERLAAEFSDDAETAAKGGEMPAFSTGRTYPAFEDAAFGLAKQGAISAPVKTPYGWHIIKLVEKRELPSYEEMEQTLRYKVAKDSRAELNKSAFVKRIKTENNFTENAEAKALAMSKANDALLKGTWSFDENDKTLKNPLFTIGGKAYKVNDFYTYVQAEQRPRQTGTPAHALNLLYEKYLTKSLVDYEKANLENKHEDYRMLVKEYHDGIILFQLAQEKVWAKAVEDTTGLQSYFEQNKEKYKWGQRAQALVISAANKDLLSKAQQQLASRRFEVMAGKPTDALFELNKSDISAEVTARLNDLAQRLQNNTKLTLEIYGHTDATEATGNRNLAAERAQKVADYLQRQGVAAAQLTTKALGKTKQAGPDKTETGRRRNRRVSFAIYTTEVSALADQLNKDNPLGVQITERKFQKGDNKALDAVTWEKGTYTLQQNGREYLIIIEDVLEPSYKQLKEVRGIATADYQNHLEREWVKQLREKYPVSVNESEIEKLVQN